jgi:two-component system chemotaxis response regulator CheB
MDKIRVLVVDDVALFRRVVADELSRDPAIEVAGTAANGRIALAKVQHLQPDIIILDVEMPEMDGLATLKELRRLYPRLPVIMFSALTEQGAEATLDALALGATDYFTKPAGPGGIDASLTVIRDQLIPEIKALCAGKSAPAGGAVSSELAPGRSSPASKSRMPPGALVGPIEVLAIGTSTGGPNALAELFRGLPADFPVPIVIVQHMPAMFTRLLAERLSAQFAIPVEEGRSGTSLAAGRAWIAPGDHHMVLTRDGTQVRLLVHQDPPENSCRPAVDVLLRSVARIFGARSLTVILTGMGEDGLRGCKAIREAGGQIVAQDEASSIVWGMPGQVARAGLADRVVPLSIMADEILHRVRSDSPSSFPKPP